MDGTENSEGLIQNLLRATYCGEEADMELLDEEEAAKLILETEEVIEAIKNGEMEGEYFEF